MNKWIEANNVRDIKKVHEFYGQSPVGMSGHQENVIFISLWYEAGPAKKAGTKPTPSLDAAAAG